MRFTDQPPPDDPADDPAVMHIGGPRGRRLRAAAGTAAGVLAVGAVLVGLFVWFGEGFGWSAALVALMIGYMAVMARWVGQD